MLSKLSSSEKFIKEVEIFKSKIEKIPNESVKNSARAMLSNLISQARMIDEGHSSRNNGNIDPRRLRDTVEQMVQLRKNLKDIIKDLDNA